MIDVYVNCLEILFQSQGYKDILSFSQIFLDVFIPSGIDLSIWSEVSIYFYFSSYEQ